MNRSNGSPSDRSITRSGATLAASDFLQLNPADAPRGGMSDWLARQIRRAVAEGLLPPGSRLPATRVLADELGVSRGVVTEAYRRLTEDGHVEGRGRAGTVVLAAPLVRPPEDGLVKREHGGRGQAGRGPVGHRAEGVGRGSGGPPRAGRRKVAARRRSAPCSAIPSTPASSTRCVPRPPASTSRRVCRTSPRSPARPGCAPSVRCSPGSFRPIRLRGPARHPGAARAVARWLALNRGIAADPDEVLIVAGTAQALGLLALVLKDEGVTRVALEDPSSLGIRQHLRNSGLASPPVPVDERGVRVDALRATGARVALLTPRPPVPDRRGPRRRPAP
ncbi:GntR family transcriptional regulator [Streptomyces alboflavus]|uniref:GntR family transcriptional regulator n=1 Tax=Streptomyces alboflavus TaxID=67267 RepID=A0A1Z1WRA9_9ACTN|nr:GntR family transcriptional regulator [Streptomyces alboflavus]